MMRLRTVLAVLALALAAGHSRPGLSQDHVKFKSQDGTTLYGLLYRPKMQEGAVLPALVLLHGCSGLYTARGSQFSIYTAWADALTARGYVVLAVDSATPRDLTHTCTPSEARRRQIVARQHDAYGALAYLQQQTFIDSERIGAIGWSQGGAIVLLSISPEGPARDAGAKGNFRAAIAFYPGACNERFYRRPFMPHERVQWTTQVPLLVFHGDADNWTPAAPCVAFIEGARKRGATATIHVYPGAHHSFDGPNTRKQELPAYRMENGIAPIVATDPVARVDAMERTFAFMGQHLMVAKR